MTIKCNITSQLLYNGKYVSNMNDQSTFSSLLRTATLLLKHDVFIQINSKFFAGLGVFSYCTIVFSWIIQYTLMYFNVFHIVARSHVLCKWHNWIFGRKLHVRTEILILFQKNVGVVLVAAIGKVYCRMFEPFDDDTILWRNG